MCKICKLNNVCYECMLCIVYKLYICVMYVLCGYVFGYVVLYICVMYVLCGYIFGYVVLYLDPYRSFKGVLYVVCTIEEIGKKVIEKCSVNIEVIYVCQL